MIASAPSFRNGSRRALGEWVCLQGDGFGSMCCSGEGDHEGRPYGKMGFVGATLVVALQPFQEVP
jgi:hypothetical protein